MTDVLLASDDLSPAFRNEARERGWKMIDEDMNMRIRRQWGDWYVVHPSYSSLPAPRTPSDRSSAALSRRYPTLIDKVLVSPVSC